MSCAIVKIPYWHQWQAGLSVSLAGLATGAISGWTSPYIAKLTDPDSDHRLKLTSSEASWIVSLPFLGRLLGAALASMVQDIIGRKKTLLWMSVPQAVGWALIIVAPTVSWLYVSRVFTGLAGGIMYATASLFLGEIADPMIRGSLIILIGIAVIVGSLSGTIMGALLPLEIFSYVCLVLTGLFFASFAFVPESPYHHLANGDPRKAENSLKWFKDDADVKREMRELQDFLGTTNVSASRRFDEFKKWEHQKNLLIVISILVFMFCSGVNSTNSYAEIILRKSKIDFTPSVVVMALSCSEVVAGLVAFGLVDKLGRKPLLMGSGLGLGLGLVVLGFHFHALSTGVDPETITLLPIFALFLIYFSVPCGISTVSDTLLGELFPPIIKTPASFASTVASATIAFAVSKSFQPYLDLVGEKYLFWTFAGIALSSVVFSYFCIPDTARKSLMDIQENLAKDDDDATKSEERKSRSMAEV